MTNADHGDRLLNAAKDIFQELRGFLKRGSWNLAVRHAQEVVELTLKGLLSIMAVEYPKVHDVGSVFAREAELKVSTISQEILNDIIRTSADLARKRAPAFYFEQEHDEDEARSAFIQAERILKLGRNIAIQLKKSNADSSDTGFSVEGEEKSS